MLKRILFFIAWLVAVLSATAQERKLTGQIVDSQSKEPIPYATLLIKNTIYGAQADEKGYYILQLPEGYEQDSISVSSLSYKEKVYAVKDMQSKQTIALDLNGMLLSEVVVYPIDPYEIMKKAKEYRDRNHKIEKPQVQQAFSRELFFDKGECFRVGESIIDVYTLKLPNDSMLDDAKKLVAARAIQDSAKLWMFNDMLRLKKDTVSLDATLMEGLSGLDITSIFASSEEEPSQETPKKKKKGKEINIGSDLKPSLKYNGTVKHEGRTTYRILAELSKNEQVIIKGQMLVDSATYAFAAMRMANQNVDLYKEFIPWYVKTVVRVMGYKPVFNRLSLSSSYRMGKSGKWYKIYDFMRYGGKLTKRKRTVDGYVQTEYFYNTPKPYTQSIEGFSTKNKDFEETVVTSFENSDFWEPRKGVATPKKVQQHAKAIHERNQQFEGSIGYNRKESRKKRREERRKRR